MTFEEIKKYKHDLEGVIRQLIEEFQTKTRTHVDIDLDRTMTIGSEPCDYPIEIHIKGRF